MTPKASKGACIDPIAGIGGAEASKRGVLAQNNNQEDEDFLVIEAIFGIGVE